MTTTETKYYDRILNRRYGEYQECIHCGKHWFSNRKEDEISLSDRPGYALACPYCHKLKIFECL